MRAYSLERYRPADLGVDLNDAAKALKVYDLPTLLGERRGGARMGGEG